MSRSGFNHTYILGISFCSALGGYLFGFDFAVIAGALPFLQKQFGLNDYWAGLTTAILALGAIVGCLVAGSVSDNYGRRKGLLVAAAIFGLSSLGMALAPVRAVFIIARFTAGAGVGMASMLSPMYIAEIAPAHLRGRMVSINQLTIVIGILITNVVNYLLRNTGVDAWRWMFGLGVVPSALFFTGAWWLPESPRWLAGVGRHDVARATLERIGGLAYADGCLADISRHAGNRQRVRYTDVFHKAVLPAVLVGIGLAVFQQLCGINVVFNYTTLIFRSIGVAQDGQLMQTIFIGAVNLVFTLLAMLLVDKLGRKPLMLAGAGGLALLYLVVVRMLAADSTHVSWYLLSAIAVYALSLAPVTWVLISEIFPGKVRGAATTVAVVSLWLAYFILIFTFPILYARLKDNTFYIYSGICVLGTLFIALKVKETRGKTLEELGDAIIAH